MSFFGDDDFSFLDTYRDRSNDEDESDSEHSHMNSSSSSSDGEDNEQDRTYTGVDSFELPQSPAAADTPVEGQEDSNDKDEGVQGETEWRDVNDSCDVAEEDELMASFVRELDNFDEGISEEEGGCDVDFGSFFGDDLFEGEDEKARLSSISSRKSISTEEEEESDDEEDISLIEGEASPHTNTTNPSGETNNNTPRMLFSVDKVLRDGLIFAGFTDVRITRCAEKRNTDRFKAHYGVCPKTVASFLEDLFHKHPSLKYKDVFMTLNWLKTYSVSHVMAAIWERCEEYINPVLEDYIAKFASLKEGKIRLDRFNDEEIIVFSIDACHFMVEEMALDPSTRWYDFKKGGAGLKYEVALSIHTNEIMWIRGPLEASIHDISMFRGYTTKDKKKNKVDKDAFIYHIPAGKKGVGDSGYSGEPNKIVTTRKGQSAEMKRWLGRVKSRHEDFVSTELQDRATVEHNVVALYQTRSVTTTIKTSVSPIAKPLRSPKSKKMGLKAKKMMKAVKTKRGMTGELLKIAAERIVAAEMDEHEG